MTEDVPQIRKADLENHNKDGGLWVVIHGKVYDVQDFKSQAPCGSEALLEYAARDATEAFDSIPHSEEAQEMMQAFLVGNYIDVSVNVPGNRYFSFNIDNCAMHICLLLDFKCHNQY